MNLTFQVCTRDLDGNIRSFGELTEDSTAATNRIRDAVKRVEGGSLYKKGVYESRPKLDGVRLFRVGAWRRGGGLKNKKAPL